MLLTVPPSGEVRRPGPLGTRHFEHILPGELLSDSSVPQRCSSVLKTREAITLLGI